METQRHRFCWRERTERLNWRMMATLQLEDMVKRGEPALLEPYALHLTFARLPSGTGDRDAWFLLRVMQLSMEYLLFLRTRDSDVLEASGLELQQCEAERDALTVSGRKWRDRARSCEQQVDKLHQLLQNTATLVQLHGATPDAVRTIETLIAELLNRGPRKRTNTTKYGHSDDLDQTQRRQRAQEARVCGHCGKIFASKDFLHQHVERRHNGETSRKFPISGHRIDARYGNMGQPNQKSDGREDVQGNRMLREVELALQSHEENLRSVAQTEALKIQEFYEKLHMENQFAEELKSTSLHMEERLQEQRALLNDLVDQKAKASQELKDLKEQIAFCKVKAKMVMHGSVSVTKSETKDLATDLEIQRLEQALTMANEALAVSREEFSSLQSRYLVTFKEKCEISEQLEQAKLHSKHLEVSLTQTSVVDGVDIPAPRSDSTTQTIKVECVDAIVETDAVVHEEATKPAKIEDQSTQTSICATPKSNNSGVQTEKQQPDDKEKSMCLGSMAMPLQVNNQVENIWQDEEQKQCGASVGTDIFFPSIVQVPDFDHELDRQALLEVITARTQSFSCLVVDRAASNTTAVGNEKKPKQFSSLQRRHFLQSRFLHDESTVKERIGLMLHALDETTRRYGLDPKSTVLSDEHLHIVQRALHVHLEILPTIVLEKIISCESEVNELITQEWQPREKARQQALERLQIDTQTKSEHNQRLVQQAMTTCAPLKVGPPKHGTIVQDTENDGTFEDEAKAPTISTSPEINAETKEDFLMVTKYNHKSAHDESTPQDNFICVNSRATNVKNLDHEAPSRKTEVGCFGGSKKPEVRLIGVKPRSLTTVSSECPLPNSQHVTHGSPAEAKYITAPSFLADSDQINSADEVGCTQLVPSMERETEEHQKRERAYQELSRFTIGYDIELSGSAILPRYENDLLRKENSLALSRVISEPDTSLHSLSVIASSELSYGASIPSLGSEIEHSKDDIALPDAEISVVEISSDDSDAPPGHRSRPEEYVIGRLDDIATVEKDIDAPSLEIKTCSLAVSTQSNRSCDSDEEEMSKIPILAENNASMGGEQFVMVQYSTAVVVAQLGRSSSPVMCFDDSDIEEVEMA